MTARRDHPEHRLSHWTRELIRRVVQEPYYATAIDHSARAIGGSKQAQINWREHQKWIGIQPSILDWHVYQASTGAYTWVELKFGANKPDSGQIGTMHQFEERGIKYGVCWNIMQVYLHLLNAGFDLHGNAGNIALETQERWSAAQAAVATVKPKRAPRKAPVKTLSKGVAKRAAAKGIRL